MQHAATNRRLKTLTSVPTPVPCRMWATAIDIRRNSSHGEAPTSDKNHVPISLTEERNPNSQRWGRARHRQCRTGRADERKSSLQPSSPATIRRGRIHRPGHHSNAPGRSTGRETPRKVQRSMRGKVAPRACPAGRNCDLWIVATPRGLLSCKDELPSAFSPHRRSPFLLKGPFQISGRFSNQDVRHFQVLPLGFGLMLNTMARYHYKFYDDSPFSFRQR